MNSNPQPRRKPNPQSTTPQSNKNSSKISLDYNSWLARFKIQPKSDLPQNPKENTASADKTPRAKRDSPITQDRPRPKSKLAVKSSLLNISPKKSIPNSSDFSSRVPSQFLNKVQAKATKPPSPMKLEPLSNYTIGNTIGSGSYGLVKYAVHKQTDQKVAIKIYEKSKISSVSSLKTIQTEIKILSKLNHPNIIKLYEHIDTPKYLYIVLEFVSGCSLSTYVKRKYSNRLEEHEANKYFKELLSAIDYCHSQGIAHHDIKLENTLIDQITNKVKLIDFGFASEKNIKTFCGTPSYMAPEIMARKDYYGKPSDIWAAGVLLFKLLTSHFPFNGETDKELCKAICSGLFIVPDYLSPYAKQIIVKMLTVNPVDRLKASELLREPWFRSSSAFSVCSTITHKSGGSVGQDEGKKLYLSPEYKLSNSFGSLDIQILSGRID